jgi:C4-dicarboxylate-specific signal transduction histidine kinase
MTKKTSKSDSGNISLIFKKEFEILNRAREVLEDGNTTKEDLQTGFSFLTDGFERLLLETVKITRISDMSHRKLFNAKEEIGRQNRTAEAVNEVLQQEIAERKQAEKARRAAEEELEEQRVLIVRSDRLRSLCEMATAIAHELSQPLLGIRGLSEHTLIGMERGWALSGNKLKDRLSKTIEQVDRMVHIINHIRTFAREAGEPEVSPVQVNEVVSLAMGMMCTQLRSQGVEVSCDLAVDLPLVSANPHSLEEIILNLLTNARDAVDERQKTDPEPPSARVLVRTGLKEGDKKSKVEIAVEDNGTGIPQEMLEKVFDPFFTTKDPDKGTGLGMSISKSIVETFGGSIQIRSMPGGGTTVIVLLPVSETRARAVSAPET